MLFPKGGKATTVVFPKDSLFTTTSYVSLVAVAITFTEGTILLKSFQKLLPLMISFVYNSSNNTVATEAYFDQEIYKQAEHQYRTLSTYLVFGENLLCWYQGA